MIAKYDIVKNVILNINNVKYMNTAKCNFEAKLKALVCYALRAMFI